MLLTLLVMPLPPLATLLPLPLTLLLLRLLTPLQSRLMPLLLRPLTLPSRLSKRLILTDYGKGVAFGPRPFCLGAAALLRVLAGDCEG